MAFIL
jgi:probable pyridine nucleotide-disulfide oxidoreductase